MKKLNVYHQVMCTMQYKIDAHTLKKVIYKVNLFKAVSGDRLQ